MAQVPDKLSLVVAGSSKIPEILVIDVDSEPEVITEAAQQTPVKAKKSCSGKDSSKVSDGTSRQLKRLSFENKDTFVSSSEPRRREARSQFASNKPQVKPPVPPPPKQKNTRASLTQHDQSGLHIRCSRDLCDCLEKYCAGCHYPCKTCRSTKCGHACRNNRRWIYDQIGIEGTPMIIHHPIVK